MARTEARISAYLTTHDCLTSGHPFEAALQSVLGFAAEVVVADGGSTDGTWERLCEIGETQDRLRLLRYPIDKTAPSWALDIDLWLRAKARRACTGTHCWQADADEIVTFDDCRKIDYCLDYLTVETPLLAVPVLEYWAGTRWVRRDQYPATPKLSLNLPRISHGLPRGFRAHDEHGLLYALPYASLSSSYVDLETLEPVSCWSLLDDAIETLRETPGHEARYEAEFYDQLDDLPVVHNFGWVSIARRLRNLRDYWSRFHQSFYRIKDPIDAWPLFSGNWTTVSDADIEQRARELAVVGPGPLTGETELPGLMAAKKELPATIRRLLVNTPPRAAVHSAP